MKVIKVIVGLIFDDWNLVAPLLIGIVISAVLVALHLPLFAAGVFWAILPISLWISTEEELKKKL